jgi:hypothetical protein
MVFWLLCLTLEVALSGRDIILVGVVRFLVIVVVAGRNCDPPGTLLSPLFATLGAFLSAFAGGFRWRHTVAIRGRFLTA